MLESTKMAERRLVNRVAFIKFTFKFGGTICISLFPDRRFYFLELDLVEAAINEEVEDFSRDIYCSEHSADDADKESHCEVV